MYAPRIALATVLGLACFSGAARAVTIELTGTVTSCTPGCNAFAFLATGSELSGTLAFDDAALADGVWLGGDVVGLSFVVFDPAAPIVGTDPPNPATDNPFTLDASAAGGGLVVADGQEICTPRDPDPPCFGPPTVIASSGTFDGIGITGGLMDIWLTQGLLAENGAVIRLDFDTGTFSIALFEGVIFLAGGTFTHGIAPVPVPAAAWLFGTALAGLFARRRRV